MRDLDARFPTRLPDCDREMGWCLTHNRSALECGREATLRPVIADLRLEAAEIERARFRITNPVVRDMAFGAMERLRQKASQYERLLPPAEGGRG